MQGTKTLVLEAFWILLVVQVLLTTDESIYAQNLFSIDPSNKSSVFTGVNMPFCDGKRPFSHNRTRRNS